MTSLLNTFSSKYLIASGFTFQTKDIISVYHDTVQVLILTSHHLFRKIFGSNSQISLT